MELGEILVSSVLVGERQRAVNPAKVGFLSESMKTMGLQTPISVWAPDNYHVHLVAGAHRLAAAKALGWEDIPCVFVNMSETDRALWEIDENLARSELTTEEMREHLRRRKELWEKRQIQVAHDAPSEIGYGKPPPQSKGFAADTAAATGLSKSQINRLLADPKPAPEPVDLDTRRARQLAALMRAWNAADGDARADFLATVQ